MKKERFITRVSFAGVEDGERIVHQEWRAKSNAPLRKSLNEDLTLPELLRVQDDCSGISMFAALKIQDRLRELFEIISDDGDLAMQDVYQAELEVDGVFNDEPLLNPDSECNFTFEEQLELRREKQNRIDELAKIRSEITEA